jgi:hypothetical protein
MRTLIAGIFLLGYGPFAVAQSPPPLVEKFLHSGEFLKGEQHLEHILAEQPKNDEARFGLGVLQLLLAVEKFGQALYEHGLKSDQDFPIPFPKNPDPATMRYAIFRQLLEDLRLGLERAEKTFAEIQDEKVKIPLRLAAIPLHLDSSGKPTVQLLELCRKLNRGSFQFEKENPEFLVCFDRGDAAWFRAYCHLLEAIIDVVLTFDGEADFDATASSSFAKYQSRFTAAELQERAKNRNFSTKLILVEPKRLSRFRLHLIQVAKLNHETWKFVRAETDNDHEWLPNSKQKGVLGLAVQDQMIDSWLACMSELQDVLEGKKTFVASFLSRKGKGINLKVLLEDPPLSWDFNKAQTDWLPDEKYWMKAPDLNLAAFFQALQIFNNPMGVAYAVWFN